MTTSISFIIKAPPFSINSAYYLKSFNGGSAQKIRTKECRDWGDAIMLQLQNYCKEMKEFKETFDEKSDAIEINLIFFIPKDKFYTKTGTISLRSNDLTNVEKLLVDILFDSRFNGRMVNGLQTYNLDINDKLICTLTSKKRPVDIDYRIEIVVKKITNKFEIEYDKKND